MNIHALRAIYLSELDRTRRTWLHSIVSPVLSTALYFSVFGATLGSHMQSVGGVGYAAFIVPGLVMLSLLTQSISNASFGIFFPKYLGTIYEVLSAPVSSMEVVAGYVGAAATKSVVLSSIILVTARFFVNYHILHPVWMLAFLVLISVTFSLFGFIVGIWADNFEKLNIIPSLIVTPLTFLGGCFYPIGTLSPVWQQVMRFNPVVYLVSGYRWSFYGVEDIPMAVSLGMMLGFLALCAVTLAWIFRTGYRLKR